MRFQNAIQYNMLIKEKISIEEFDDKRYQIRLVEPLEEEKAVLTHYLHNIHNGVSKHLWVTYLRSTLSTIKVLNSLG